ncbi:MAG: DUF308 domain-containing protein [Bacteroidota bacterium]
MDNFITKSSTTEILKGVLALLLGLVVFIDPARALVTIATYLGILGIIGGIVLIATSLWRKYGYWQFLLFQGIVFAIIGGLIVAYPDVTAGLMVFFVGLLITFMGVIQLIAYLQVKELTPVPTLSLVNAILSLLIGVLLLFNPFQGAVLATLIMGAYALWYGVTRLYIAWLLYTGKGPF